MSRAPPMIVAPPICRSAGFADDALPAPPTGREPAATGCRFTFLPHRRQPARADSTMHSTDALDAAADTGPRSPRDELAPTAEPLRGRSSCHALVITAGIAIPGWSRSPSGGGDGGDTANAGAGSASAQPRPRPPGTRRRPTQPRGRRSPTDRCRGPRPATRDQVPRPRPVPRPDRFREPRPVPRRRPVRHRGRKMSTMVDTSTRTAARARPAVVSGDCHLALTSDPAGAPSSSIGHRSAGPRSNRPRLRKAPPRARSRPPATRASTRRFDAIAGKPPRSRPPRSARDASSAVISKPAGRRSKLGGGQSRSAAAPITTLGLGGTSSNRVSHNHLRYVRGGPSGVYVPSRTAPRSPTMVR